MTFSKIVVSALVAATAADSPPLGCKTGFAEWMQLQKQGKCGPSNSSHADTCADGCADAFLGVGNCTAAEFNNFTGSNLTDAIWEPIRYNYAEYPGFCKCLGKLDDAVECFADVTDVPTPWNYTTAGAHSLFSQVKTSGGCAKCSDKMEGLDWCKMKVDECFERNKADPTGRAYVEPIKVAYGYVDEACPLQAPHLGAEGPTGPEAATTTPSPSHGNHSEACKTGFADWMQLLKQGKCGPSNSSHADTCAGGCAEAAVGLGKCTAAAFNDFTGSNLTDAMWEPIRYNYAEYPGFCGCLGKLDDVVECFANVTGVAIPWNYTTAGAQSTFSQIKSAGCAKCSDKMERLDWCKMKVDECFERNKADPTGRAYVEPIKVAYGFLMQAIQKECIVHANLAAGASFALAAAVVASA